MTYLVTELSSFTYSSLLALALHLFFEDTISTCSALLVI